MHAYSPSVTAREEWAAISRERRSAVITRIRTHAARLLVHASDKREHGDAAWASELDMLSDDALLAVAVLDEAADAR